MTISSEVRKAGPYVGNDVSTSFSFAFKVFSSGDVIVVLTNPSEEESILVEGDDYTVTLNDNQDTSPGGSIEKSSALADGYLLTVTSGMENLQPVEITNLGGFYPSVLNSALDRMTILIQQVSEQVDRAVKTPISSGLTPDELLASIVESDSEAAASASEAAASASDALSHSNDAEASAVASAASVDALADDLASTDLGKGAELVAFVQAGTGAVQQTTQNKLRKFVSGDDYISLQAAIDNSGSSIIDGCGLTYSLNSMVTLRSNLTLKNMTLDFSSLTALDGSYRTCIKAQGTGVVDSSALTANAAEGAYSVTVADGSKFSAGDYAMLTAEDAYNYPAATVKRGEIKQVQGVSGNTVTFREAIYEAYATANTATLRKLSMLENITLDRVKIIGTNIEGHNNVGFRSQYVRGLKVRDCSFENIDLYECALFDTIDFDVSDNTFDGVRYTGVGSVFYGVVLFNCCQWGAVTKNMGQELRHLVTTSSSGSYYGQPYFVTISKNVMRNAMGGDAYASWAYENHGFGRFITWANNHADSCHTGINIEKGDQIVIGNTFRNCRFNGIYFDADGRDLQNILIANNRISKVTGESPSGTLYGIAFLASASQVRENILITGNIIDGFGFSGRSDFGIRVYAASGSAKSCVLSNNIFQNNGAYESSDYGAYIEQPGWAIRGNTFKDYERSISLVAGADGCIVQGNDFSVTTVSSTQACVVASSSNNVIQGNAFSNVYRSVSAPGSGNIVSGNIERSVTVKSSFAETISAGALTFDNVIANPGSLAVETEGLAATDYLDTINGGYDGQILILRSNNSARDVVVKDGTGNIRTSGDMTLSHIDDRIVLIFDGSNWCEMSRSDNAA